VWLLAVVLLRSPQLWAAESPPPPEAASIRYDAKGKRDPFVPLVRDGRMIAITEEESPSSEQADLSLPLLGGILWDPAGRSIALLNDREQVVGDMVGSFRLVEIHQDHVVLEQEDRRVTLQMTFEEHVQSELESQP
jgi:hypothetical protein